MSKRGLIVCIVNAENYPFIILRETLTGDIIFCLKDENPSENDYEYHSYIPKDFYHMITKYDEFSIRSELCSKRAYISDLAREAFEKEYETTLSIPKKVLYAEIENYLQYREIEVDYLI